ncbi:hypothetical protein [Nocardiopsis sp. NPDC006832]|uniref:hypothetical protein n=1 Tax=Nocardiopsis sp. NPDC006832 TaxID=3157188 RepID=UPI0033C7A7C4
MSAAGQGLSADPDGINQDGKRIYEAADYTDEIVNHALTGREPHGVPWGEEGDYSQKMQETLGKAEDILWELLPMIASAQRQAADGTLRTAGGFGNTEESNVDLSGAIDTPLPGGRR